MTFCDQVKEDDLIVLISAHVGYISHIPILENLPTKIENRFPHHSRIVIYPKQYVAADLLGAEDFIFTP